MASTINVNLLNKRKFEQKKSKARNFNDHKYPWNEFACRNIIVLTFQQYILTWNNMQRCYNYFKQTLFLQLFQASKHLGGGTGELWTRSCDRLEFLVHVYMVDINNIVDYRLNNIDSYNFHYRWDYSAVFVPAAVLFLA
jgi:hypothetical protein